MQPLIIVPGWGGSGPDHWREGHRWIDAIADAPVTSASQSTPDVDAHAVSVILSQCPS